MPRRVLPPAERERGGARVDGRAAVGHGGRVPAQQAAVPVPVPVLPHCRRSLRCSLGRAVRAGGAGQARARRRRERGSVRGAAAMPQRQGTGCWPSERAGAAPPRAHAAAQVGEGRWAPSIPLAFACAALVPSSPTPAQRPGHGEAPSCQGVKLPTCRHLPCLAPAPPAPPRHGAWGRDSCLIAAGGRAGAAGACSSPTGRRRPPAHRPTAAHAPRLLPPHGRCPQAAITATSQQSRFHTETLETACEDVDLKQLTVAVGDRELLADAHLRLTAGTRYGLLGRRAAAAAGCGVPRLLAAACRLWATGGCKRAAAAVPHTAPHSAAPPHQAGTAWASPRS